MKSSRMSSQTHVCLLFTGSGLMKYCGKLFIFTYFYNVISAIEFICISTVQIYMGFFSSHWAQNDKKKKEKRRKISYAKSTTDQENTLQYLEQQNNTEFFNIFNKTNCCSS